MPIVRLVRYIGSCFRFSSIWAEIEAWAKISSLYTEVVKNVANNGRPEPSRTIK
ncbi:hypothetical protein MULP_01315 [Mycobacterium liflandii 128FXT]|uniref:Uncharacterized protein n=1 Tax=Mycobacterium liflandii (strain 128FXT) TaxID=459424 RepID=L7V558_MYCL1|nr:hypothetical protein MULP_01315 [Mycobacterium liflandii 128FXT]